MEEITNLEKSFQKFNETASKIMEAYAKLEREFANLNRELEFKNKQLEKTIEEKEDVKNYLNNILESLTTAVIVTDLGGYIQTTNRCAEIFLDSPREGLPGRHISSLLEGYNPEIWDKLPICSYHESDVGEKVTLKGRILDLFASPMVSRTGQTLGRIYVLRDITRMERFEDMAKQREKLAAMGEMAANIAHEIRNPLGSIELYATLLLKDIQDKKNRQRITEIVSAVKNVDNKIANLLFFAKTERPSLEPVVIADLLSEIIAFSDEIIDKAGVFIDSQLDLDNLVVMGKAEMLKQVFLNVILNALQSMPEGGRLSIRGRRSKAAERKSDLPSVELTFTDTGGGIVKENLSRIFDPFFTTKEGGAGLGLAIAYNIVALHGGSIYADSEVHRGTTITILLPLKSEERGY